MATSADLATLPSQSNHRSRPPDRLILGLAALALLLPWAILFIAIPPAQQDFPLNDDWAFAKGAFAFADGNGINYQGWASMPLIGQWIWAYPFIELLGKSHAALRLSTLILGWLCLVAFYDLVRNEAKLAPPLAAFVTVALGLTPYFFWLSGTFMTDIPALAFSLIPLALYARALRSDQWWLWLGGTAVALLGAVTRQNTIIVPIAAGVALVAQRRQRLVCWLAILAPFAICVVADVVVALKHSLDPHRPPTPAYWAATYLERLLWLPIIVVPLGIALAAPAGLAFDPRYRRRVLWWLVLLIPVGVCVSAHYWLQGRADIVRRELEDPKLEVAAFFPFIILHFVGLAAVPVLTLVPARRSWVGFCLALAFMAGSAAVYYQSTADWLYPDPTTGGIHFPYPLLWLPESNVIHGYEVPPVAGWEPLRWALTVLGCIGGAEILVRAGYVLRARPGPGLLVIFTLLHLPLLLASPVLYDRYQLVLIPGALAVGCMAWSGARLRWPAGFTVLLVSSLFAIAVYHDRLSWNTARWAVGRRALAQKKVPDPAFIEGGLEWDGWYCPGRAKWEPSKSKTKVRVYLKGMSLPFMAHCFPHLIGQYALSPREIPGTRVVDSEPFRLWLAPTEGGLFVDKRFFLLEWTPGYADYRDKLLGPPASR